ncbi:hypothetical protein, partial [Paenibacillus sp. FJAT-27812]|uniref:hypothetical protein n=1 Tax=Paenibacillus sp. FJAT-27812 TaxID=1684143 RepID=UPI003FA5B10C
MSKIKKDNQKPLVKGMSAVLSATMATASIISVLPAQVASADEAAAIAEVNAAATVSDMQAALTRVDLALNLTGYNSLSSTGKDIVAQNVIDYRTANGSYATQPSIQTELNTAVSARQNVEILLNAINAVNSAASASDMRTALENTALGLILTTYNNLSTPSGKLGAAQLLLDYRTANGSFADQAAIQSEFNNVVQDQLDEEALSLAVGSVNAATDAATMTTALEDPYLGLVLTSFHNLSSQVSRDAVAQQMHDFKQSSGAYASKAAIQSKLNTFVSQRAQFEAYAAAVQVVNDAATANDTQSALEASDLGLNLTEYYKLVAGHRNAAALAVLNYKIANGAFADQPSIQSTLSAIVVTEQIAQAVDVVNATADTNSMKSALVSATLGLTLTAYNDLGAADKNAVAALVLANRGGGYTDKAAVQTSLDLAIVINAPMSAVNKAADAAAIETALENGALALALGGVYPSWQQADQTAVAAAVLAARPGSGYVNLTAVQTAFDAAVTARTPIADVNIAADAAATQTALEAGALFLTLGVYSTWSAADKTSVAAAVHAGVPVGGYADKAAIQAVFDAAVTARTPVADVNIAANAAATKTALEAGSLSLNLGSEYPTWTAVDKTAVATAVNAGLPVGGHADKAAVQTAFDAAVTARTPVANVNVAVSAAAIQTALEAGSLGLNLGATYPGWLSADKAAVAAEVLAARPVGDGYAGLAAIQAAFDSAVSQVAPMAEINAAANAAAMETALESGTLALTLSAAYNSLSASDQTDVAGLVLSYRPVGGYADKPAVQAALDIAVAVEYVNIAANASATQTALEDGVLSLNLGAVYPTWTAADKTAVAATVHAGVIYADKAAIQSAFDAAVTARTP